MPLTYVKISDTTVTSGGASFIEFTSIPNTYTDLELRMSDRSTGTGVAYNITIALNGSDANQKGSVIYSNGTSAASDSGTGNVLGGVVGGGSTASYFGNVTIYFYHYANAKFKVYQLEACTENQTASPKYIEKSVRTWEQTAAITSIKLTPTGSTNWAGNTQVTLFGILRA